jgi:hypothetical protein
MGSDVKFDVHFNQGPTVSPAPRRGAGWRYQAQRAASSLAPVIITYFAVIVVLDLVVLFLWLEER